jgi:tRNA A-37 threonylcarbamoyl transferase component Bud32
MHTRRLIGVVLLALAVAGALGERSMVRREEARARRRLLDRAEKSAQTTRASVKEFLQGRFKTLEAQAAAAASLNPIKQLVVTFDPASLRDGLRSETWWEPYRRDFSVSGMAYEGDQPDALEGMEPSAIDTAELVKRARADRTASMILLAGPKKWPYLAAAAVVEVPRPTPAVLLMARPFDLALGQEMAEKLGGAVLLSAGQAVLVPAGPQEAQEELKSALGKESLPYFAPPDLGWVASATQLLPGLSLWTHTSLGGEATELHADMESSESTLLGVEIAAAVVALVSLFLIVRPAPAAALPAPSGATGSSAGGLVHAAGGHTSPRSQGHTGATPADTGLSRQSGSSDPQALAEEAEGATLQHAAPGNVFGRYYLLDRLGEGGMAEVFTAVAFGAENFRRTFVVKRLRAEMLRNQGVVSSFIDEANLASSLVHSNIVPVFDFGRVGDEYYMATEYILGRDLGKVNRRSLEQEQKTLTLGQAFFIVHQTLEALDYAHNRLGEQGQPLGIVHRDVSPNNILISARGEVKLFDFGIAKAEGRLTQTQVGMVKGNVRFMSPEQARGELVDARSDLFALGLVLYYALSGDSLYEGDNAYNLLVKAAQGPGPAELAAVEKLPKEAHRIVLRAGAHHGEAVRRRHPRGGGPLRGGLGGARGGAGAVGHLGAAGAHGSHAGAERLHLALLHAAQGTGVRAAGLAEARLGDPRSPGRGGARRARHGFAALLCGLLFACGPGTAPPEASLETLDSLSVRAKAGDGEALGFYTPAGAPLPFLSDPYTPGATLLQDPGADGMNVFPSFVEGRAAAYAITEYWDGFPAVWTQPLYFFVDRIDETTGAPHIYSGPVFGVGTGSRFYSSYWQIYYVYTHDKSQTADLYPSEKAIFDAGFALFKGAVTFCALGPQGVNLASLASDSTTSTLPGTSQVVTSHFWRHPLLPGQKFPVRGAAPAWVEGEKVWFVDFGRNRFKVGADLEVEPDALFKFAVRGADGQPVQLPLPSVGGTGPLYGWTPPEVVQGVPQFGTLWREYAVILNPTANAGKNPPAPFIPQSMQGLRAMVAQAVNAASSSSTSTAYGALYTPLPDPSIEAIVEANPAQYAEYTLRVAKNPLECFEQPNSTFPKGPADGGVCLWLDSQRAIEANIGSALIRDTGRLSSCPIVYFNGAPVP